MKFNAKKLKELRFLSTKGGHMSPRFCDVSATAQYENNNE
jgi:hypothetical protein